MRVLAVAAVAAAAGLAAAPAHAAGGVAVSSISSLKGSAGTLRGTIVNDSSKATRAPVVVSLHRWGTQRTVLGRSSALVAAHSTASFRVAVRLPRLKAGSYYLSACTPTGPGTYGCATGENDIVVGAKAAPKARVAQAAACTSGAHTLSKAGQRVYPETGNGGYTSTHTDVNLVYDAPTNLFLPGTHVDLTQVSTQCLSDFSVDFERTNPGSGGPDMSVQSVTIDGQPATFKFVQPTYPGDPNGQDDPDPLAHRSGLVAPVSATNPNPPACNPANSTAALQDQPCPANKLVITPSAPIAAGTTYKVTINYTGRPGTHQDGDNTTEGWFRNDNPVGDGAFVTTEPVGTMAWMPLNNHPSSKPTYDFYSTAASDRVAISNGRLIGFTDNAADANFPAGSRTWHWKSPETIANYLVENSIGHFDWNERFSPSGVIYYEAQSSGITTAQKATNKGVMDQQEDIVHFQERFNGTFPFSTDGVIVGIPSAGFEEEMQTKITFQNSRISLGTFHHENMHQWWGDNVTEDNYNRTTSRRATRRSARRSTRPGRRPRTPAASTPRRVTRPSRRRS